MSSFDKVVKNACKPKATPPKAKYLDPIIAATWSDDGSVHDVCKALAPRLREPNAIVVFKALIVLHTVIRNGATDNVLSYLSSSDVLRLKNVGASQWEGYKAPENLKHYALYLDSRIRAYKDLKHDAVRVQSETNRDMRLSVSLEDPVVSAAARSANNGRTPQRSKTVMGRKLRVMTVEKGLLRETRIVQRMIDALVLCQFYLDDLEDELNVAALRMLVKDLLILFQAGNEGVINVLEHYFEMSHVDATQALAIYRHFCSQTERVVEFLSVAKKLQNLLGVSVPNLKHAPVSLVGALEEYLNDPNFEQNRIEYKTNKDAADRSVRNRATAPSPTVPGASEPSGEGSSSSPPPANKSEPNKAIADFFSAIEEEQPTMFNPHTNSPTSNYFAQQATFNPFQPQPTGFPGAPGGLQPQFTAVPSAFGQQAFGQQPFGQQQQPFVQQQQPFGLQPQATGFLQPQATGFLQPQVTGSANPFRLTQVLPQGTGLPFSTNGGNPFPQQNGSNPFPQQQQQQQNGSNPFPLQNGANPFPQQNGANPFPGLVGGSNPFPQQQLQSQPTGANPFPSSNPFPSTSSSSNPFPSAFAQPLTSSISQPFSSSSSSTIFAPSSSTSASTIARPASTPITSAPGAGPSMKPVKTHATGSRNPFGAPKAPSPPPVPKAPTLFEIALGQYQQQTGGPGSNGQFGGGAVGQFGGGPFGLGGNGQQQQQQQQQGTQSPPASGAGISSVASSFLTGTGGATGTAPKTDSPTSGASSSSFLSSHQTGATLTSLGSQQTGATSLFGSSSLSSQPTGATSSFGGSQFGSGGSNLPGGIQPQATGFSGLKAFKPTSSFGASLLDSLPAVPSSAPGTPPGSAGAASATTASTASSPGLTSSFGAMPGGLGTGALGGSTLGVGLRPQATGAAGAANPFRASMFPATGAGGAGFNPGAGASLFTQPTGFQATGLGSSFGAGAFGQQAQGQGQGQQSQQQGSLI